MSVEDRSGNQCALTDNNTATWGSRLWNTIRAVVPFPHTVGNPLKNRRVILAPVELLEAVIAKYVWTMPKRVSRKSVSDDASQGSFIISRGIHSAWRTIRGSQSLSCRYRSPVTTSSLLRTRLSLGFPGDFQILCFQCMPFASDQRPQKHSL